MSDDWGVPDWTQPAEYPVPADATDRVWQWEFLRRRPDYRDVWHVCSAFGIHGADHGLPHAQSGNPDDTRLRFGVSVIYDPRLSLSDDLLFRASVFYPTWGFIEHRADHFAFEAGVTMGRSESEGGDFRRSIVERQIDRHRTRDEAEERAGLVRYVFDVSKPLEPQFRQARPFLDEWQRDFFGKKGTPRPRRDNWQLFLRALDGRDAGATWAAMGKTFWPEQFRSGGSDEKSEQSARDTHKAAVQVRDNFPV